MLEAVSPSQINSTPAAQVTNTPDNDRAVAKIAVYAIRALGVILVAVGIGCLIANLQVPPIALLVSGVVAIVLGFVLDKGDKSEKEKLLLPATIAAETNDESILALDRDEAVNLQPEIQNGGVEVTFTPVIAFGKQEWIQYIGDPGEVPPLPANIISILLASCPFWGLGHPGARPFDFEWRRTVGLAWDLNKKVLDTHMLVLIPKTVIVGNKTIHLTLRNFMKLVRSLNHRMIINANEHLLDMCGDDLIEESHWVLMTKDVLYESKDKSYDDQKGLVEARGYEVPNCSDAAIAIFLENLRSETKLFKDKSTRCQKHVGEDGSLHIVAVGDFEEESHRHLNSKFLPQSVVNVRFDRCYDGMAAMKRL